jgi:putative ABC transport system permease protein
VVWRIALLADFVANAQIHVVGGRRLVGTLLKVPFRLLHFPGVGLAAIVAALILALATTSTRLFIASTGEAVLRQQFDATPTNPPLSVSTFYSYVNPGSLDASDDALRNIVSHDVPGLGPGVFTVLAGPVDVLGPGGAAHVQPASRTGFADHVHSLERAPGDGVWLSDTTARAVGVHAGDTVMVRNGSRPTRPARVTGIYRDLAKEPPAPYWGTLFPNIYPNPVEETEPPPLMLATPPTLGALGERTSMVARLEWDFFLPPGPVTIERVSGVVAGIERVKAALLDGVIVPNATTTSPLPPFLADARRAQAAVSGPVEAMSLSGRALALALAAAAGFAMVRRRRGEFMVMAAQGVGGLRLGARAMVEAALPMALGALGGWGLGLLLARHYDPAPAVPPEVVRAAAGETGVMLVLALVVLGVATWLVATHETRERVGRIPGVLTRPLLWEGMALLLAVAALYEVTIRRGAVLQGEDQIPRVDRLLVLFPLLLIGGLAGLASRGLGRLVADRMTRFSRLPPVLFLALRRLSAAPRMALLLLTASSVSLGLLAYAGVLDSSTRATALAKARVVVGSDASVAVAPDFRLPADSRIPATRVQRIQQIQEGTTSVDPDSHQVAVLAIDPSTFARGAFWDRSFATRSLDELLSRLDHARAGRLGAIAAGGTLPFGATLTVGNVHIPLEVTVAKVFPGMPNDRPVVVVSREALDRRMLNLGLSAEWAGGAGAEVWAKQDLATLRRELGSAVISTQQSASAAALLRTPAFAVVSWTLGMLQVFSVAVGMVTVAGLLLYVQARQRAQLVAYALLRRMGLARWAHWLSAALELAGLLLLALAIGALLAIASAALVVDQLDLAPSYPPAPLLRLPVPLLGGVVLVLLAVALAGAVLVQWRAERANLAEVMRVAG